MFDIAAIQSALRQFEIDAWLLYDFRGSNVLARRILQLDGSAVTSRRFFYCIPAAGAPHKLVHRIESGVLDHLPGKKTVYLKWQELEAGVERLVDGCRCVAMEYSPRNANPYVARADAGTVELVKACGAEIVSSGDLIQEFEATWDDDQWQMHLAAAELTDAAFSRAWSFIVEQVSQRGKVRETLVQREILQHFSANGLTTSHPPIVAVGPHSGDPHYEPTQDNDAEMGAGDFVLIDLWAKLDQPRAVYSDLTRVGFIGETVPKRYEEVFQIVAAARDAAIELIRDAFSQQRKLAGWQVDQAARAVIDQAGYGDYFIHRTGHSIGQETHGNGANMDNLETQDNRQVLPGTCFSIEPGIYLPEFGIRSEVNVFVNRQSEVHVTGGKLQRSVMPIV